MAPRALALLALTLACAPPATEVPRSPCGPDPDHAARDHFESCEGRDLSRLCCLDGLAECLDPADPYGVHECGEPEPCLSAYLACDEAVTGGPSGRPTRPRSP